MRHAATDLERLQNEIKKLKEENSKLLQNLRLERENPDATSDGGFEETKGGDGSPTVR